MNLLELHGTPIFEQLKLEEALLRADDRNWCLINRGSTPAIVMGISGKGEAMLHHDQVERENIEVYKRYSGGGTVVVDEETLFVSFIGNHDLLDTECFPEPLMRWTEPFYAGTPIELKENDYVIGEKKVGGNAQYIKKERFCHHTSFLWDYKEERMACLTLPKKQPKYREGRDHKSFITPLSSHLPCKEAFIKQLIANARQRFDLVEATIPKIDKPYRIATSRHR